MAVLHIDLTWCRTLALVTLSLVSLPEFSSIPLSPVSSFPRCLLPSSPGCRPRPPLPGPWRSVVQQPSRHVRCWRFPAASGQLSSARWRWRAPSRPIKAFEEFVLDEFRPHSPGSLRVRAFWGFFCALKQIPTHPFPMKVNSEQEEEEKNPGNLPDWAGGAR